MPRQRGGGEARDADRRVERDEQRRVHDRAHLLEHLVVAGLHDGAVEADVRLVVGLVVRGREIERRRACRAGRPAASRAAPARRGGPPAPPLPARSAAAPRVSLPRKAPGAAPPGATPARPDRGGSSTPGPDPRSRLRPRHHQSLGGEDLDRLADDPPAGAHAGRSRQLLAGPDLARDDAAADGVHDAAVQARPRIAGARGSRRGLWTRWAGLCSPRSPGHNPAAAARGRIGRFELTRPPI